MRRVALLPIDGSGAQPFAALRDLLFASSAFPLAFAPVPLAHCLWDASQGVPRCEPREARVDDFIDGGVFDNQPLGLAVRSAMTGLERSAEGTLSWRDAPEDSRTSLPDGFVLGYLDPDAHVYPARTVEQRAPPKTALGMVAGFLSTFVQAARTKGLVSLFTDHPELRSRVVVAQGNLPLMSEPLGAFFGFFEEEFRRFDFYAGMYDAATAIDASPVVARAEVLEGRKPPRPEDGTGGAGWAPLQCMRAVLDGIGDARERCAGDDLSSFRILLQLTLARLQSHCRALAAEQEDVPLSGRCAAAAALAPLPRVPGLPAIPEGRLLRGRDEGEVDYVLRVLALYGFRFRDLGLSPQRAGEAPYALRFALGEVVERFVDVQPEGAEALSLATRALNLLRYIPPRHIVHVSLGTALEAGYSYTDPRASWRWLRPSVALTAEGFMSWSSSGQTYVALTPFAGVEFEPVGWNGAVTQLRFGARGGYMFSSQDAFATGACDTTDPRPCSRFLVEGYASLSLFDLARLKVGAYVAPPLRSGEAVYWGLRPTIGVQWVK
jgi:hypothetical protein